MKAFEDKRKAEPAKKKAEATTLPDTSMPPPAPRSPWSHEPIVSSVPTGPTMTATPAPPRPQLREPDHRAADVALHQVPIPAECNLCGAVLVDKYSLTTHIKNFHMKHVSSLVMCPHCSFRDPIQYI